MSRLAFFSQDMMSSLPTATLSLSHYLGRRHKIDQFAEQQIICSILIQVLHVVEPRGTVQRF